MVTFNEDTCWCDSWEAHDMLDRGYESRTKGLVRKAAPWTDVITCGRTLDDDTHTEINKLEEYSISQAIASFYLLDIVIFDLAMEFPVQRQAKQSWNPEAHHAMLTSLLEAGITIADDRSLKRLSAEAQVLKHTYVTEAATHLRNYLHFAIAGELRYHELFRYSFNTDTMRRSYRGWKKLVKAVGGAQAAEWAAEMFRDVRADGRSAWHSYYGGESWAQIADVLAWYERGYIHNPDRARRTDVEWWHPEYNRGEFSAYEFFDRVASLQHNTGTCLSKSYWNGGLEGLKFILDCHHHSNLRGLLAHASKDAAILFERYWQAKNELSGTDIPLPQLGQCHVCLNYDRDEFIYNNKPRPYCKAHFNKLCVVWGCENEKPKGQTFCDSCLVSLFHGVPESFMKHERGDGTATLNHPDGYSLSVCVMDGDCYCEAAKATIEDGIIKLNNAKELTSATLD